MPRSLLFDLSPNPCPQPSAPRSLIKSYSSWTESLTCSIQTLPSRRTHAASFIASSLSLTLPSDRPPPAAAHAPPTVTAPQSAIDNRILHTRPSANVGVGLCTAWLLVHPCVCTHIRTHAHTHTHTHTPHSDAEWNVDTWKYKGHPHTLVVNQVDVAVPHATNYRGLGTCIHSFTHICVYSSIHPIYRSPSSPLKYLQV